MASKVGEAFVELTARNAKLRTKMRQSQRLSEKAAVGMQKTFDRLGRRIFIGLSTAFSAVLLKRSIQLAAQTETLNRAFVSLAGGTAKATSLINAMDKAFKGTVSRVELLKQANNALLLGLPATESIMAELAEAGRRLGKAVGQDAKFGFESLVVGIGRQSRLMLDNLGIIVKAEEAYKTYAATLGKTAAKLTATEKRAAFLSAAMEAVRERVARLGEDTDNASDSWDRFKVAAEKALTALGKGLLTGVDGINGITVAIEKTETPLNKMGQGFAKIFSFLVGKAGDVAEVVDAASKQVAALWQDQAAIQKAEEAKAEAEHKNHLNEIGLTGDKSRKEELSKAEETTKAQTTIEKKENEKRDKERKKALAEQIELWKAEAEALEEIRKGSGEKRKEALAGRVDGWKEAARISEEIWREEAEKRLSAGKSLSDTLRRLKVEFLRNIGLEKEADLRKSEQRFNELLKLAKDNTDARELILAAGLVDRKRIEEKHREELKKTERVSRARFVGAEELFRRAAIAGATRMPAEKAKPAPTDEEKQIAKDMRKTAENTEKMVEKLEANIATLGE